MSQEYIFHAPYGESEKVEPYLSMYTDNDNIFMGLTYEDPDLGKMPYTDVTVNITKLPYLMAAIDTNNNGQEIMDFLVDNGLAMPLPGQAVHSGFVDFPIVVFNSEALAKIDPEVFAEYQEAYGMDLDYSQFDYDTTETFYYTFGTDERFPYQGGWVEVNAYDQEQANEMFRSYFPDRNDALNCAFVYNSEEWAQTPMAQSDAPDQVCHMTIDQFKPELRFDIDLNNGNLTCWIARPPSPISEGTVVPLTKMTTSLPYLHAAINMSRLDENITNLLNDGLGHFTGYTIEQDGTEYSIFKFNEDKVQEMDPTIFAVHQREKETERSQREEPLDALIDKAKERTAEKNQAFEDQKEAPIKKPHDMDR